MGYFNLLDNLLAAIISGIIVSTIFEVLKCGFVIALNRVSEKSLPFTVDGYWGTYHSLGEFNAFEFIILKQQGVNLKFSLYQQTNDGRFHFYRGVGYIRGSKISLAYHEANKNRSNSTGTFNLLVHNASEHSIELIGNYTEYSSIDGNSLSHPYSLIEFSNYSFLTKIKLVVCRKCCIKKILNDTEFQDACKTHV